MIKFVTTDFLLAANDIVSGCRFRRKVYLNNNELSFRYVNYKRPVDSILENGDMLYDFLQSESKFTVVWEKQKESINPFCKLDIV